LVEYEQVIRFFFIWDAQRYINGTKNSWIAFIFFNCFIIILILVGYISKRLVVQFTLYLLSSLFLLTNSIFSFILAFRNYILNIFISLAYFSFSIGFFLYTIKIWIALNSELRDRLRSIPEQQIPQLPEFHSRSLEDAMRFFVEVYHYIPKICDGVMLGEGFENSSEQVKGSTYGFENHYYSKVNNKCLNTFLRCRICNRFIDYGEEVFCPFCNAPYHETEFLEWLKIKAYCKDCNRELDLWELQTYLKKHNILNEKYSKLCKVCNKQIPDDAIFCIYCGNEV